MVLLPQMKQLKLHCIWVVIYTDHFCKSLLFIMADDDVWNIEVYIFRKLKSVVVFLKITSKNVIAI